jgi:hypothetical protein
MSRGLGKLQKALFGFAVNAKRSVSYAEIIAELLQASGVNDPTAKLRPDRERAIRRALKSLCDRDLLSTLGGGRPYDPYRYTLNKTCVLCREEMPVDQSLENPKTGAAICFRCTDMIIRA